MTDRAPFDPTDPLNVAADYFRREMAGLALKAGQAEPAYRDLPLGAQLEAFMYGAVTGLVGVCLGMIEPKHRDAMMDAIVNYLPLAREQAEAILDAREKRH